MTGRNNIVSYSSQKIKIVFIPNLSITLTKTLILILFLFYINYTAHFAHFIQ